MHGLAGLARAGRDLDDDAVARPMGSGEGEELAVVAEGGGAEAAGVCGDGAGGAGLRQLHHGEVHPSMDGEPATVG